MESSGRCTSASHLNWVPGARKNEGIITNVYLVPAENFILRKIHIGKICKIKISAACVLNFYSAIR